MIPIEDKFCIFKELSQGEKFIYNKNQYMILPSECKCYGETCNAINLTTGTMTQFKETNLIDLETMTMLEEKDIIK